MSKNEKIPRLKFTKQLYKETLEKNKAQINESISAETSQSITVMQTAKIKYDRTRDLRIVDKSELTQTNNQSVLDTFKSNKNAARSNTSDSHCHIVNEYKLRSEDLDPLIYWLPLNESNRNIIEAYLSTLKIKGTNISQYVLKEDEIEKLVCLGDITVITNKLKEHKYFCGPIYNRIKKSWILLFVSIPNFHIYLIDPLDEEPTSKPKSDQKPDPKSNYEILKRMSADWCNKFTATNIVNDNANAGQTKQWKAYINNHKYCSEESSGYIICDFAKIILYNKGIWYGQQNIHPENKFRNDITSELLKAAPDNIDREKFKDNCNFCVGKSEWFCLEYLNLKRVTEKPVTLADIKQSMDERRINDTLCSAQVVDTSTANIDNNYKITDKDVFALASYVGKLYFTKNVIEAYIASFSKDNNRIFLFPTKTILEILSKGETNDKIPNLKKYTYLYGPTCVGKKKHWFLFYVNLETYEVNIFDSRGLHYSYMWGYIFKKWCHFAKERDDLKSKEWKLECFANATRNLQDNTYYSGLITCIFANILKKSTNGQWPVVRGKYVLRDFVASVFQVLNECREI